MAKNDLIWKLIPLAILAYIFIPSFQTMVNQAFPFFGNSSSTSTGSAVCQYDSVMMQLVGTRDTDILLLINGNKFNIEVAGIQVLPYDKVELFYRDESHKYWEETVSCSPTMQLNLTVPEDIKAETGYKVDPYSLDYGSGGTILPDLGNTSYDFENLDELNLDI